MTALLSTSLHFSLSLSFYVLIQSPQHSMSLVDSHLLCTSEGQNAWRAACAHAVFDWVRDTLRIKPILGPISDMYAKWSTNTGLFRTIETLPDGLDLL